MVILIHIFFFHVFVDSYLHGLSVVTLSDDQKKLTASVMVDDRSLSKRDIADFLKNLLGKHNVLA